VNRFRFIQVDEYQDTNRAQNEIVELLAGEEDNVLAVGDVDQSIYEWRGASPDAIQQFIRNGEKKTGKCTIIKLGVNYRSTPQFVQAADRLIRHCAGRIPVEFSTVHPAGEPVKCLKCKMPEEEAAAVASSVHTIVQAGTMPREIAVFYRTNDMSRLVEQELAKRKVPYMVVGGGSYYDRMEVKDVLSMLRFVCNPRDGISFARVANKPARGMGDALVGRLEAHAERHHLDLLSVMRRAGEVRDESGKPLSDAALAACRGALEVFGQPVAEKSVERIAGELLERTRYDEWLKEKYEAREQYEERRRNVHELLNAIADFGRANPRAGIADYLQSIALYTEADTVRDDNAVRLMSLHASKGLEFDVVYMIGVEQGILPHEKAVKDRGERGLEEERRLCYVGFTRARKVLRVTWCGQRQDVYARDKAARYRPSLPSRFLVEAGLLSGEEYQRVVDETRVHVGNPPRHPLPYPRAFR
jgi:DNA helicase-2/ATP-dependent DNA helicase PcrA